MKPCPKCNSEKVARQRRPHGNTRCTDCGYSLKSAEWDEKRQAWHLCYIDYKNGEPMLFHVIFSTREDALDFANQHCIDWELIEGLIE